VASKSFNKRINVSLVIPVRDEAGTVRDLYTSITAQSFPPCEIIFVDGGSADGTVGLLRELGNHDGRVRIIEAGEATPGRGRNVGIAAAKCDWVALTDAGVELEPEWLEKLVEVVERDSDVEIVYGSYEPVTDTDFEKFAALAYPPPKQFRNGGLMRGPSTASMMLHRMVWETAGGFPDLRAAEDLIFMRRVEEMGYKTGWAPDAVVQWRLRPDLASTFRRFVLYSRHNVWAGMQRYWHHGVARQYLTWLVFLFLALIHSPWWMLVPVLGVMIRVAKSIWVRRETRGILWAINPLQFASVAVILLTIDLATFIGWWQAIFSRRGQLARQGVEEK
jgi:glycosyltransferase involved in cell wall biosynthesis